MSKANINLTTVADPQMLADILNHMDEEIDALRTVANELRTWAETLATKLNADAGVTDENYDATISAAAVVEQVTRGK